MTTAFPSSVAILTPWYPSTQRPFLGAFVKAMVEATAPGYERVTVYQCDEWAGRHSAAEDAEIVRAHHALLPHALRGYPTVGGATRLHLPVPLPVGLSYAEIAQRHSATVSAALGGQPIDAPVVHAHVGLPGGWAALRNARPDARVFVTEHATFLDAVLAQPEAREMYAELLRRCAGVFAVGRAVRDPLVEAFPEYADRVRIIPNPVSFAAERATPVTALRRWLFVGGLIPRKGVQRLLEAFALCRADDPTLTLTFVGEGPLQEKLTARAAELGVTGAIRFTGAVPPEQALGLMREHDLLVHPSQFETFGMTVVEASAAGMPVLVTRCGGPEESLAGIEDAAGELVPVEDDPESLAAGYRRLRDRFTAGMDLGLARRELAARYGYPAVAQAHRRAWFPDHVTTDPAPEQGH
ncbi:glycosyltransferase [Micromonospora cathayae]|uniref:Glycosyltransferase n=1 Tax=Micromonospora cathayae TaxID=3028804 RepID=A0ABY7ZXK8_9ACTN|nr:glycosyltransferase [Micromonospora sp. HUAS 3]WDZ87814.1 glycosyltransferase [Micromonospora sp. HUAS 3]